MFQEFDISMLENEINALDERYDTFLLSLDREAIPDNRDRLLSILEKKWVLPKELKTLK